MSELINTSDLKTWATATKLIEVFRQRHSRLVLIMMRSNMSVQIDPSYQMQNRTLSEMSICNFLDDIEPPSGFERREEEVIVSRLESNTTTEVEHIFYYNSKSDTVLCLTPGQFVDALAETPDFQEPGARIQLLKTLSETSSDITFTNLGLGITAMTGCRSTIKNILGIDYIPSED